MRVRFWGTRGSIAKPGPSTARYGGNTCCVEVRTAAGTLVVLDCGTGAHNLGQALLATEPQPLRGHILITHTHWDHIQGIPFFAPLFASGNQWDIYAPRGLAQSLRDTLAGQMQYTYFPLSLEQLGADVRYHDLVEGTFTIDDIEVQTQYLNHTALTLGYRLEGDGVCLVYSTDHEPYSQRLASGSGEISGQDLRHAEFLAGADLVVHDAQYTAAEYPDKVSWGHSSHEYAVAVSRRAEARRLALIHHDPSRDDDALDRIVETTRARLAADSSRLEVFAAAEGQTVELTAAVAARAEIVQRAAAVEATRGRAINGLSAIAPISSAEKDLTALVAIADPATARFVSECLSDDGIRAAVASDSDTALHLFSSTQPSLVVLEEGLPGLGGLEVCRAIRHDPDVDARQVPVIVLAGEEDPVAGAAAGVSDWLIRPFSSVYARTRVRASLLRTQCRWIRAPLPADEDGRLATLRGIGVLDTQPEERFDRLTRLAAALFKVPMALISLVDRDRQWYKSCQGTTTIETSREVSLCAHAILSREVTVVPDTLLDGRFADNPLVTGEPHIRFYAGYPIRVSGQPVGTLCIVDTRPHQIDAAGIRCLEDLGVLAQRELTLASPPA